MASPLTRNLNYVRGDDFVYSFRIYDVDDFGIQTPRNLTGATGKGSVRPTVNQTGSLTADMVFDTTQLSSGIVTYTIAAATMEGIVEGVYYYDLQITHGGVKKTWIRGSLTIEPQVTTG